MEIPSPPFILANNSYPILWPLTQQEHVQIIELRMGEKQKRYGKGDCLVPLSPQACCHVRYVPGPFRG